VYSTLASSKCMENFATLNVALVAVTFGSHIVSERLKALSVRGAW
jgi:ABC-type transport system involved in cytochrome bd biosynthesis fused ATPase/permease subunit